MSLIAECMARVAARSVREPGAGMQLSELAKRLQGGRQPVSEAPGSRPQRLTNPGVLPSHPSSSNPDLRGGRRASAAGRNHLSIAVGSAAEACAVLDLVHLEGRAEVQEKLRRVGIMLLRLGGG